MAKAKKVVDEMFLAASIALADHVDQERIEAGTVYPPLEELREVSAVVSLRCLCLALADSDLTPTNVTQIQLLIYCNIAALVS